MELERAETYVRESDGPRTAAVLAHLAFVAIAFAILDRSELPAGRVAILALFAGVRWFRMAYRLSRAPRDPLSWRDALLTTMAAGTYQLMFASLGATRRGSFGTLELVAMLLYVAGAALSTSCEAMRAARLSRPGSAGALLMRGPFSLVRYPKYLGDVLWASGWALATRTASAWVIVCLHAAILVLVYIPALDRRLRARHGAAYGAWAERTARIVPFVY